MTDFIAHRTRAVVLTLIATVFGTHTQAQDRPSIELDDITIETVNVLAGRINPYDLTWMFAATYYDGTSLFSAPINGIPAPGDKAAEDGCNARGNPVIVSTGNKVERESDFTSNGEMPLNLERSYNFLVGEIGSLFGPRWLSSFDFVLKFANTSGNLCTPGTPECPAGAPHYLYSYRQDGRRLFFTKDASGVFREAAMSPLGPFIKADGRSRISISGSNLVLYNEEGGTETYDAFGKVLQVKNRHGITWTFSYSNGRLDRITHSSGRYVQLSWSNSRLSGVTDPAGNVYQYGYQDGFSIPNYFMLSSVVLPGPPATSVTYHYDPMQPGKLFGKSYNGVRYSTFAYDSNHRVTLTEHAGGVDRYTFAYTTSADGNVAQTVETNPLGKQTTYAFSDQGRLTSVTGLASAHCAASSGQRSYDPRGHLDKVTDPRGSVTDFDYDIAGWLQSKTEAAVTAVARTTAYVWDTANSRIISETLVGERQSSYTYHADGRLASASVRNVSPNGVANQTRTTTYTYTKHPNNMVASMVVDGPAPGAADAMTYAYSPQGDLSTASNSLGHTITYSNYNALGLPGRVAGPNTGQVTDFTYDARGRVTQKSEQGFIGSTTYTYHANGLVSRIVAPSGAEALYSYDNALRVTSQEGSSETSLRTYMDFTYDNAGNPTSRTLRLAADTYHKIFEDYDELGRLRARRGNNGQNLAYRYDLAGNVESITDSSNRIHSFAYDALNRVASHDLPSHDLTIFGYDKADRVIQVRDPRLLLTSYTYDGLGQLLSLASPDTGTTTHTYDAAGNRQTTTDARGAPATYTFDALNRVSQASFGDQTITYTYDAGASGKGRLTGASDAAHSLSLAYNAQGQITAQTQTVGTVSKTVGYQYENGLLKSVTTPSGHVVSYTRASGRVRGISVNGAPILGDVLYQPFGPTRGWNWANATSAIREYDDDGRVRIIDSAGMSTYAYAPDNRLTSETNENPLYVPPNVATTLNISGSSNRLVSTSGTHSRVYTYDAAGNVTADGTRSFTYNNAGRLTAASGNGNSATYTYNAFGLRARKTVNGVARYFVHDVQERLLGEYSGTGALIQEIVWMDDIPVAVLRPNGSGISLFYIHTDHLNTPRRITRPSDNRVVWRWSGESFGATAAQEDPDGDAVAFNFNLRFAGQYYDLETGLHHNIFRDYDPQTGRYVQSDPVGLLGGLNTYAYVASDPIGLIDPAGLDPVNLGDGYTGRLDPFNYGGESSFEVHVFDKSGNEVGVYGPKGWINKHGLDFPPKVPAGVENSCRGIAIDRLRGSGQIPEKGKANIKGSRFLRFLRALPLIGPYMDATRPTPDRLCEIQPDHEICP
jgi:RHS repeat-associated protein